MGGGPRRPWGLDCEVSPSAPVTIPCLHASAKTTTHVHSSQQPIFGQAPKCASRVTALHATASRVIAARRVSWRACKRGEPGHGGVLLVTLSWAGSEEALMSNSRPPGVTDLMQARSCQCGEPGHGGGLERPQLSCDLLHCCHDFVQRKVLDIHLLQQLQGARRHLLRMRSKAGGAHVMGASWARMQRVPTACLPASGPNQQGSISQGRVPRPPPPFPSPQTRAPGSSHALSPVEAGSH